MIDHKEVTFEDLLLFKKEAESKIQQVLEEFSDKSNLVINSIEVVNIEISSKCGKDKPMQYVQAKILLDNFKPLV